MKKYDEIRNRIHAFASNPPQEDFYVRHLLEIIAEMLVEIAEYIDEIRAREKP